MFCGKSPKKVTKEHVIPRWLIELTGDPHRTAAFGPFWNSLTHEFETKHFAFDQFAFPACETCNHRYSTLEGQARVVMQEILSAKAISSQEIGIILTWLDKVRVGLWLVAYSIQKNPLAITPAFFINSRVARSDRMVLIYRSNFNSPRLRVEGCTVPAFQLQPSCFAIVVNNYVFLNVSTDFLVSEQMGLPYPSYLSYTDTVGLVVSMLQGREKMRLPIVRFRYDHHCTQIFQPLYAREDIRTSFPLYDTDYVKSLSLDHDKGIGKVFVLDHPVLQEYPLEKSKMWVPKWTWDDFELLNTIRIQLFEVQLRLLEYGPSERKVGYDHVKTKRQKRIIKLRMRVAKEASRILLKRMTQE